MKDQLLDTLLVLAASLFCAAGLAFLWVGSEGRYAADPMVTVATAPGAEAVPYREEP